MNSSVRRGRFILAWFVAGIAVLPLSAALAIIAVSISSELIPVLWSSSNNYSTMFGLAHCWLASNHLGNKRVLHWIPAESHRETVPACWPRQLENVLRAWRIARRLHRVSLPGRFVLSAAILRWTASQRNSTIDVGLIPNFSFCFTPVSDGVLDCAMSRSKSMVIVSGSWRWIAAHVGSVVIAALASLASLTLPGAAYYDAIVAMALYVLVVTLATGIVMLRMLASSRGAAKDTSRRMGISAGAASAVV